MSTTLEVQVQKKVWQQNHQASYCHSRRQLRGCECRLSPSVRQCMYHRVAGLLLRGPVPWQPSLACEPVNKSPPHFGGRGDGEERTLVPELPELGLDLRSELLLEPSLHRAEAVEVFVLQGQPVAGCGMQHTDTEIEGRQHVSAACQIERQGIGCSGSLGGGRACALQKAAAGAGAGRPSQRSRLLRRRHTRSTAFDEPLQLARWQRRRDQTPVCPALAVLERDVPPHRPAARWPSGSAAAPFRQRLG